MSPNRWKSSALAIVCAASSVVGTDQPADMVAKTPPVHSRLVIAKANLPTVLNPPVVAPAEDLRTKPADPPVAVGPTNSPPSVTEKLPAAAAAQELPAAAGTVNPPVPASPPVVATDASPVPENPAPAEPAKPSFDRRILAVHNRERQDLGLDPLIWNPALAESARRWADHLAQTGRFEHAPENRSAPEGENLWAGTKGYYTPEAMVGAWIREKRYFRPGTFPDNSTTGRVEDIGHYTQVVWRATREVGCAEAASAAEDILVCRYAEAGNYRGEQPF